MRRNFALYLSKVFLVKTSSNPSGISGPASSSPSPLHKTLEESYGSGDTPSRTATRIALGESLVFPRASGENKNGLVLEAQNS